MSVRKLSWSLGRKQDSSKSAPILSLKITPELEKPFDPGKTPKDLGLKEFEEIRGIHLGYCPGWEKYGVAPYYVERVRDDYQVAWVYQPKTRFNEGAHTHMHPADPYYLHICFWESAWAKTTVLLHEYCHILWILEQNLKPSDIYKKFGERGIEGACHDGRWRKLMTRFGLPNSYENIFPQELEDKYYINGN